MYDNKKTGRRTSGFFLNFLMYPLQCSRKAICFLQVHLNVREVSVSVVFDAGVVAVIDFCLEDCKRFLMVPYLAVDVGSIKRTAR
jgi:hypothetical protein